MPAVRASVTEDIRRKILDLGQVGSIEIRSVRVGEVLGSDDEPILRVSLTVSDPVSEELTWPAGDVEELQGRATEIANGVDAELPWVVVELYPVTPDEPDDGRDDPELGRGLDLVED